jgi:transporter family-2 protein
VSEVPKGQLIGGLLGVFYVYIMVVASPKIGVASTLIAVIAGQLLMGSIIDHFGLFGGDRYPLDGKKLAALALMFVSIYLFNSK